MKFSLRRALPAALAWLAMACDRPATTDAKHAFVVFSQPKLFLAALNPVAAPVVPGSTPSPATMASSNPEVVSVQPDGTLAPHRNGKATIRAAQGDTGQLEILVQTVQSLRIEPPTVRL